MNIDQIRAAGRGITGRFQEGFGKIVGSQSLQEKRVYKNLEGDSKLLIDDARDLIKQSLKKRRKI